MQLQATEYTATDDEYNYEFTFHKGQWTVNRWKREHVKIPPYVQALAEDLTWRAIILFTGYHKHFPTVELAVEALENARPAK